MLSFARIVSRIQWECVLFFHFARNTRAWVVFFLLKLVMGKGKLLFFWIDTIDTSILGWTERKGLRDREACMQCARQIFSFLFSFVFDAYLLRYVLLMSLELLLYSHACTFRCAIRYILYNIAWHIPKQWLCMTDFQHQQKHTKTGMTATTAAEICRWCSILFLFVRLFFVAITLVLLLFVYHSDGPFWALSLPMHCVVAALHPFYAKWFFLLRFLLVLVRRDRRKYNRICNFFPSWFRRCYCDCCCWFIYCKCSCSLRWMFFCLARNEI